MTENKNDDKGKAGKTKKVVRYTGLSDIREIDAASWKRVGAEEQGKVVWNAENGHSVDASEFNAAALKHLEADSTFSVEEVEV